MKVLVLVLGSSACQEYLRCEGAYSSRKYGVLGRSPDDT